MKNKGCTLPHGKACKYIGKLCEDTDCDYWKYPKIDAGAAQADIQDEYSEKEHARVEKEKLLEIKGAFSKEKKKQELGKRFSELVLEKVKTAPMLPVWRNFKSVSMCLTQFSFSAWL